MIAYGIRFKQKLWFYDTPSKAIGVAKRIHKDFEIVEVELN